MPWRDTHVVTRDIAAGRGRYFGDFSDERFNNLPYVKEYGCLPPGYHAYHLTAAEMEARSSERFRLIKEMPLLEYTTFPWGYASAERDLKYELEDRQAREWAEANPDEVKRTAEIFG